MCFFHLDFKAQVMLLHRHNENESMHGLAPGISPCVEGCEEAGVGRAGVAFGCGGSGSGGLGRDILDPSSEIFLSPPRLTHQLRRG